MSRPRLETFGKYLTTSSVASSLNLSPDQFVRRIKAGVFPPPTQVINGVRYFSQDWLEQMKR